MKKIFFIAATVTFCALANLNAQSSTNTATQPVPTGRDEVLAPAAVSATTSDSAVQAPSGKIEVVPVAPDNGNAGQEGQPSNSVRKPD